MPKRNLSMKEFKRGIKEQLRRFKRTIRQIIAPNREPDPNLFLQELRGVIHVGANTGQERGLYASYGLNVLWIEPIPEIFETLQANLAAFPKQRAVRALITDRENATYTFHLADNKGLSSSILEMRLHRKLYPDVEYENEIPLTSTTLPALLQAHAIDAREYDGLVLDTQGSELLVLDGASPLLHNLKFIKTEAADFEAYAGGCTLDELTRFLAQFNFHEFARREFSARRNIGKYYDVVYKNIRNSTAANFATEAQTNGNV